MGNCHCTDEADRNTEATAECAAWLITDYLLKSSGCGAHLRRAGPLCQGLGAFESDAFQILGGEGGAREGTEVQAGGCTEEASVLRPRLAESNGQRAVCPSGSRDVPTLEPVHLFYNCTACF